MADQSAKLTKLRGVAQQSRFSPGDLGSSGSSGPEGIKAFHTDPHSPQLEDGDHLVYIAQLEGANAHLRQRLEEALLQAQDVHNNAALSAQAPPGASPEDAVSQLAQERALQEARNARVLALLHTKDEALEACEARSVQAMAESAQLRSQLTAATRKLDTSQVRVEELVQANSQQLRLASKAEADRLAALAAAEQEAQAAQRHSEEAASARAELDELRSQLAASQHQDAGLAAAAAAAQESFREMQGLLHQRARQVEQGQAKVQRLQRYVTRLLRVPADTAPVLVAAAAQGDSDMAGEDLGARIARLQEANAVLEHALVQANLRVASAGSDHVLTSADSQLLSLGPLTLADISATEVDVASLQDAEEQDVVLQLAAQISGLRGAVQAGSLREQQLQDARDAAHEAAAHTAAELTQAQTHLAQLQVSLDDVRSELRTAEGAAAAARAAAQQARAVETGMAQQLQDVQTALQAAVAQHAEALDHAQEECASLAYKLMWQEAGVAATDDARIKAEEAAAAAKAAAAAAVEEAARRQSAAERRGREAISQLLATQLENSTLKSTLADLERQLVAQSAKISAQDAAASLLKQWSASSVQQGRTVPPFPAELAQHLQEAAARQMELHQQLETATMAGKARDTHIARLLTTISRLQAVLQADSDPPTGRSPADSAGQAEDGDGEAGITQYEAQLQQLREALTQALAAQEGQAGCFAALAAELHAREGCIREQLQHVQHEASVLQVACSTAVGGLQGALAKVALARGDDHAADALLHAEARPVELPAVAADAAGKLQEHADLLAQGQHAGTASLLDSQRAVIRSLTARLMGPQPASEQPPSRPASASVSLTAPSLAEQGPLAEATHLDGLCGLLQSQLDAVQSAASGEMLEEVHSMQGTLSVLRSDLAHALALQPTQAASAPPAPAPVHPELLPPPSPALADHAEDRAAQQVEEMAERIAALSARVQLLTVANEAARAEADHAKEAATSLVGELTAVQQGKESDLAAASQRESELLGRLQATQRECSQLVSLLQRLEQERDSWEAQMQAKLASAQQGANSAPAHAAPVPAPTSHERLHANPDLSQLLDGLEGLLGDATAMEERIRWLERSTGELSEEQEHAVAQNWSRLAAGQLRARAVHAVHQEAQRQVRAVEVRCAQHAERAQKLLHELHEIEQERDALKDKLAAAAAAQEEVRRQGEELHAAQLAAVQARAEARLHEVQRRGDAMAVAAASAAEQRAKSDLGAAADAARRSADSAQRTSAKLQAECDALHAEFVRFQALKAAEIRLLEQRVGLQQSFTTEGDATVQVTTAAAAKRRSEEQRAAAAGEIAAACRGDAVAAALREAKLERSHRAHLEEELRVAQAAAKKVQLQLRTAEKEATALRQRAREASAAGEQRARELTGQLATALAEAAAAQEAGAAAAAEVQQLQRRLADVADEVAHGERVLRHVAQREVEGARAVLAARGAAAGEVAGRVVAAEEQLQALQRNLDQSQHELDPRNAEALDWQ